MNEITVEMGLALTQQILGQSKLTEVQKTVFRGVWTKQSYQEIMDSAEKHNHYYSLGHLKNIGSELWQSLTDALGERVTKTNLPEVLVRYQHQLQLSQPQLEQQDWGDAPEVSVFYGRSQELATLKQWVVQDNCRLVAILGMGGMGKTSLAVKLAQQVSAGEQQSTDSGQNGHSQNGHQNGHSQNGHQNGHSQNGHHQPAFEYVIWRSLLNAPPLEELLTDWIKLLSQQQEVEQPATMDGLLSRLRYYLQKHRCLLVLDNLEAVLKGSSYTGEYRPGYEAYGQLLELIGKTIHQSCLVVTSREKPTVLAQLEGKTRPVRSFDLRGLTLTEAKQIFAEVAEFEAVEADWQALVHLYSGNPLGLEMVAKYIHNIFLGSIHEFLQLGSPIFNDLLQVLSVHFQRLSAEEQEIVYWMAINREPISIATLREDILDPIAQAKLPDTLQSLQRRWAVERSDAGFTLQPVLMEYVTYRLLAQIIAELNTTGTLDLFNRLAMQKAQTKDYIRQAQHRLILTPLIEQLLVQWGGQKNVEYQFRQLLEAQRTEAPLRPGYLGGNVINLLRAMNADLSQLDCSYLAIWQADLQGATLHQVNFTGAHLSKSRFTSNLNATLAVAFSPDGQLFATGNADGNVRLWRVSDGKEVMLLKGHHCWVASVDFSADGQTLASASFDQTIKIWCLKTGECLRTFQGGNHQLWAVVRFSPDGRQLVGSGNAQNTLKIWDVVTGECTQTLVGHTKVSFTVDFSPDSRLLVSGSNDQTLRIWEVQTGKLLKTFTGHEGWVRAVAFGPPGTVISGGSDCTVKLWDIATGACLSTLKGHQQLILSMSMSADGRTLATASQDCTIRIWDLVEQRCLKVLQGHPNGIWSVAFHPDGNRLISGSNDSMVKLWNVQTGQSLITICGYSQGVRTLGFSPDGNQIVSAGDDRQIRIWDVQSGTLQHTLSGHKSWIWSVVFRPDGWQLASGSNDMTIRLWNSKTWQCERVLTGHTNLIMAVDYSPAGDLLVSGSCDQTLKLWQVSSGTCIKTLACCESGRIWDARFVDADRIVSAHDDGQARLWDWRLGTCLQSFKGHEGMVFTMALSSDRKWLATGSVDQTIKLWDLSSGECLQILPCHRPWSLAFSPDGRLLMSGSSEQQVRIWDWQAGKAEVCPAHHLGEVWAVASSSKLLGASGGQQGSLNLWNLETGEWIKTLRDQGPYEGMNLSQINGLTAAQKMTLFSLGAVEA